MDSDPFAADLERKGYGAPAVAGDDPFAADLARKQQPAEAPREIGRNESFGFGALKGGTFGTAPAIAKAGGQLSSYLPESMRQWLIKKTTGIDAPTVALQTLDANPEVYRDQYTKAQTEAQQANPKTFLAGEIAGSTLAPTPGGGLVKGATSIGGKIAARGVQGAATGAMFGAGEAIGEGASGGDILKRGAEGAAGGAVLNPVLGAAGDVVGSAASKLLQRKAEKRMVDQAIKDIAGSRETGLSKPTDRRMIARAADSIRDELSEPDGLKIADTARKDPAKAWEMVQRKVDGLTTDRTASYASVDTSTGGVRINDLRRDLAAEISRLGSSPGQSTERQAVESMIKDIDETWGKQLAPTVPTIKMREYVTKLQRVAADTMGGLEETRRVQILDHVSGLAKTFLDKHLDEAAKADSSLRPVVEGLREQNKRVSAWLSLEDALKTRASKLETNNMVDNRGKIAAGGVAAAAAAAHYLHSPGAAALAGGVAVAPYVLPPLDRAVTRGLAGMTPGPVSIGNAARYIQAARNARLTPPSEQDYTQP